MLHSVRAAAQAFLELMANVTFRKIRFGSERKALRPFLLIAMLEQRIPCTAQKNKRLEQDSLKKINSEEIQPWDPELQKAP